LLFRIIAETKKNVNLCEQNGIQVHNNLANQKM
jgi:hypothetical protein